MLSLLGLQGSCGIFWLWPLLLRYWPLQAPLEIYERSELSLHDSPRGARDARSGGCVCRWRLFIQTTTQMPRELTHCRQQVRLDDNVMCHRRVWKRLTTTRGSEVRRLVM